MFSCLPHWRGPGQTNSFGNVSTNWAAVDLGATNLAADGPGGSSAQSHASVRQQSRLVGLGSNLQLITSGWLSLGVELKNGASGLTESRATNQTTLHFTIDSACLLRLRSIINDPTPLSGGFTLYSNVNPIVSADWLGIRTNGILAATNWRPCFVTLMPGNYRLSSYASGNLSIGVPGKFELDASYQFELLLVDSRTVLVPLHRLTLLRAPGNEVLLRWPIGALRLSDLIYKTNYTASSPWMFVTNVPLSDGNNLTARIRADEQVFRVFLLAGTYF